MYSGVELWAPSDRARGAGTEKYAEIVVVGVADHADCLLYGMFG